MLPWNPVVNDVLHVDKLAHAEGDAAHAPQINLTHQIQVKLKFNFGFFYKIYSQLCGKSSCLNGVEVEGVQRRVADGHPEEVPSQGEGEGEGAVGGQGDVVGVELEYR